MTSSKAVHETHRWVIDEVAPDFTLLDVWALPVHGTRTEFTTFLEMMADWDPTATSATTSRVLFAVRRHLGAALGWDDPSKRWPIPGCTETSLVDRLPENLRRTAEGAPGASDAMRRVGAHLVPLYRTDQEAAAEISNATVHGVLQFTWVERQGRFQGHLAVYVKPRGLLGRAYLLLIQPFRHLVVYPALLRQVEQTWKESG